MGTLLNYKSYDGKDLVVGTLVYTIFIDPSTKDYHVKEYRVTQLIDSTDMIVIQLSTDGTHTNVVKSGKVHTDPSSLVNTWIETLNNDIKELNKRINQLKASALRYIDKEVIL